MEKLDGTWTSVWVQWPTATPGEATYQRVAVAASRSRADGVALTFFRALKTFRLTFLRMRDICKIINVQRKDKAFMV